MWVGIRPRREERKKREKREKERRRRRRKERRKRRRKEEKEEERKKKSLEMLKVFVWLKFGGWKFLKQYKLDFEILMMEVLEYCWDDDDMDIIGNQNCCYDVVMMLVKVWMVDLC